MPHTTPNQTDTPAAEPPGKASPQPSPPNPPGAGPDNPAPEPGEKGALFRALVDSLWWNPRERRGR